MAAMSLADVQLELRSGRVKYSEFKCDETCANSSYNWKRSLFPISKSARLEGERKKRTTIANLCVTGLELGDVDAVGGFRSEYVSDMRYFSPLGKLVASWGCRGFYPC